jgi:TolB protein
VLAGKENPDMKIVRSFSVQTIFRVSLRPDRSGQMNPSTTLAKGAIFVLALALSVVPATGYAAFPGANGQVAFSTTRDGNYEIYVMNADGSGQTNLTNHPALDVYPAWSPDGVRLAFTSYRDGAANIYLMDANGANQTRLTDHPAEDWYPVWSPDGTRIAFNSNRDGNVEVYLMNADGSGQVNLTNFPAAVDSLPAWSPDGGRLLFVSDRDGNDEIYVMKADGSSPSRLTNDPALDFYAVWSADGTQIIFVTTRDGNYEIYRMNADGSGQSNLTNHPGFDSTPSWQRIPPTPQQAIEALIAQVRALVPGALNNGQGNALIVKLEAAIRQVDRGNIATAINQLEAFINQVNAYVASGRLTPEQGQPLLDAANAILAALGGQ